MGNVREPKDFFVAPRATGNAKPGLAADGPRDAGSGAQPGARDHARALQSAMLDLGRMRSLRDPIAHIISDLTPPQVHTVMWLGVDGPQALNVVAQRVACTQPTFTGIVDRLEKAGLVERERVAEDRRIVRVKLTDAGQAMYAQLDEQMNDHLSRLLALLDVEDRDGLIRILSTLVERVRQRAHDTEDSA